ncbi:hypothetical protein GCM10020001_006260 [Nonomuraea salmonea]
MYGPLAIGLLSKAAPAPVPLGKGVKLGSASALGKSAYGFFRWMTTVLGSGVSMVSRSPDR